MASVLSTVGTRLLFSMRSFTIIPFDVSRYFQGQKGSGAYIPHHASPAVAASAAAAREAAAAGNGEIMPATSLFVRKVCIAMFMSCYKVGISIFTSCVV